MYLEDEFKWGIGLNWGYMQYRQNKELNNTQYDNIDFIDKYRLLERIIEKKK